MNKTTNRRKAPRLRYRVTVWFAEDSGDKRPMSEGQMLDISSGGLAFRCNADENGPYEGQQLIAHFSIPYSEVHDPASMMKFARTGRVLRVQQVNSVLRNVAFRFDEPLSVGKVFFHNIGLYLPNPADQSVSADDRNDMTENPLLEEMLDQRISELEKELAELKRLQLLHSSG